MPSVHSTSTNSPTVTGGSGCRETTGVGVEEQQRQEGGVPRLGKLRVVEAKAPNKRPSRYSAFSLSMISRNLCSFAILLFQGGTNPEGKHLAEHCLPCLQRAGVAPTRHLAARCRLESCDYKVEVYVKASPWPSPLRLRPPLLLLWLSKATVWRGWGPRPIPELCPPGTSEPRSLQLEKEE